MGQVDKVAVPIGIYVDRHGAGHVELRHSTLVCMRAGWDTGWTGLSHSTCQHMQKLTLGADLVDIIGGSPQ